MTGILGIIVFFIILYFMIYIIFISNDILENSISFSAGEIVGLILLEIFNKKNFIEYLENTKIFFKDIMKILKKNNFRK